MQDGALQLMDSLCNETQELVKLDLSSCGLTSQYIFRLNAEVSFFSGILELNLGGNPIMQDVSLYQTNFLMAWHTQTRTKTYIYI